MASHVARAVAPCSETVSVQSEEVGAPMSERTWRSREYFPRPRGDSNVLFTSPRRLVITFLHQIVTDPLKRDRPKYNGDQL